ncbi:hypothetical protein [Tardiphaga sp.]|uniref:hypothetical protein n=1 Tax=Tardiphaga sp. TaxID=1926292 RepID=UPI002634A423|nr:hypothetical protein [Tardiphaga sp.]MDB5620499.1 hypothetical protein [Tardiphaga sp.]
MRTAPLTLILLYIVSSILLFFWGPLPWPVINRFEVQAFLALALTGITIGFLTGSSGKPAESIFLHWRYIVIGGAVLSAILLPISAYLYTGKMPWQIIEALRDQNHAYEEFQRRLTQPHGSRTLISSARALAYPVIFAVIPLGILHWRSMTAALWLAWSITALSSAILSVLRGTDREIFDLLMISCFTVLVAVARECVRRKLTISSLILSRRAMIATVVFVCLTAVATAAFVDRRIQRTGYSPAAYAAGTRDAPTIIAHIEKDNGWNDLMCIRAICTQRNHPLIEPLPIPAKYGVFMLTSYLTNGYYGLSLAMSEQDWNSTRGLGHSQALMRIYEKLTGDTDLYKQSVTYGLRDKEWSDGAEWSTIFPWLANDVGFWPGSLILIAILAFIWGKSWVCAVWSNDDAAAIVFAFLVQLFVYLPANNQLAQTLDAYFAFTAWLGLWAWRLRRQGNLSRLDSR